MTINHWLKHCHAYFTHTPLKVHDTAWYLIKIITYLGVIFCKLNLIPV